MKTTFKCPHCGVESIEIEVGNRIRFNTAHRGVCTAKIEAIHLKVNAVTIVECSEPFYNYCMVSFERIIAKEN